MKYCRHCGHQVSDDAAFCRSCGKHLTEDAPAAASEPVPTAAPEPAPTSASESDPSSKPAEAPKKPQAFSRSAETNRVDRPETKSKLPLIIAIVVVALVGGYAFMALWPGFHTSTPPVSAENVSSSAPEVSNSSAANNTPSPSNASAPSNASSTQTPESKPSVPAASTDKRPTFSEFDWYYNLPRLDVIPSNGKPLKDFQATSGGWKAMLLYDAMGEEGVPSRELLNVSINGTEKDFTVIIDPYQAQYGQELEDETKIEDTVLNGKWNGTDNTLTATKGKKLSLAVTAFYTNKNTQYALGRLTFDGGGATLLMMRP